MKARSASCFLDLGGNLLRKYNGPRRGTQRRGRGKATIRKASQPQAYSLMSKSRITLLLWLCLPLTAMTRPKRALSHTKLRAARPALRPATIRPLLPCVRHGPAQSATGHRAAPGAPPLIRECLSGGKLTCKPRACRPTVGYVTAEPASDASTLSSRSPAFCVHARPWILPIADHNGTFPTSDHATCHFASSMFGRDGLSPCGESDITEDAPDLLET